MQANEPATVTGPDLQLDQRGTFRYQHLRLFKVYDATLFAPTQATDHEILSAQCPFELRLRYLRNIDRAIILKYANRILEETLDPEERSGIAERIGDLHAVYPDMKRDDVASLSYDPLNGTSFSLNQKKKITIPGKDFAEYYLRIWLGAQPASNEMRKSLLGD